MLAPDGGDDRAAVETHLRRLDADALAALVADLWAARGFETTRDGTTVTATSGTSTLVIRVADGGIEAGTADLVVDASGGGYGDTEVTDASDIAERLWYAVDAATRRDLCRRHLGAEPSALSVPTRQRARRLVPGLGPRSSELALALGLVVLVGGLVWGVSAIRLSGTQPADGGSQSNPFTPMGVMSGPFVDRAQLPPGVSTGGIVNLNVLARAHRQVLAGQSYTLTRDVSVPRIRSDGIVRIHRVVDYRVDGTEYLVKTMLVRKSLRQEFSVRYHDGTRSYLAELAGSTEAYRQVPPLDENSLYGTSPSTLTRQLVGTRLSTEQTVLAGSVRRGGERLYRLVGRGQPEWSALRDVTNYTVVALVRSDGLVREMTINYTVFSGGRFVSYRRTLRYERIGETVVDSPAWYRRRFADNQTTDGSGGASPTAIEQPQSRHEVAR